MRIILFQGDSGGPLLINSETDDKLEIVGESFLYIVYCKNPQYVTRSIVINECVNEN